MTIFLPSAFSDSATTFWLSILGSVPLPRGSGSHRLYETNTTDLRKLTFSI